MMTSSNENIFRVTGLLWGESKGGFPSHRPVMRNFDILLSAPEQTAEQTIKTPVIWDAIALIMTSLQWTYSAMVIDIYKIKWAH